MFKLLGLLDSWLDEDDYLKRMAVLMYYLPDKFTQVLWENLEDKNGLINTLLHLDGVDQEYVSELAEGIKANISNFIDKTDALGTVFDKLPEYHRNKVLKNITEQNILPKGYILRFNDVFKQPKNILKEKLGEIPLQTLALAMQTISKPQINIIFNALDAKKGNELKNQLKLIEDQRICQDNIDKAKEFIVKYFNYSA
jgi:flagellar motor switch protein FliG